MPDARGAIHPFSPFSSMSSKYAANYLDASDNHVSRDT